MSNSIIDAQERLFDYEVIIPFVALEDADEEMLRDFALWLDYQERDKTRIRWNAFQKYLGAQEAL